MLFRGRQPDVTVWKRFRTAGDAFVVHRREGLVEVEVRANAARVVDLFLSLVEELPPAVALYVEDVRTNDAWSGRDLALPDVGEALARLKLSLSTYAGTEVTAYSHDEQLTLTPGLTLFAYARTERWVFLLRGHGLVERAAMPVRSWHIARGMFPPAPDASLQLRNATERLGLERV